MRPSGERWKPGADWTESEQKGVAEATPSGLPGREGRAGERWGHYERNQPQSLDFESWSWVAWARQGELESFIRKLVHCINCFNVLGPSSTYKLVKLLTRKNMETIYPLLISLHLKLGL